MEGGSESPKNVQEQAKIERIRAKELKKASNTQSKQESTPDNLVIPGISRVAERATRSGRVVKTPQKL